ncbi:mutator type transposase [Tanacetum coccineum]
MKTTINIDIERDFDVDSQTRQFKRVYICLGALKNGFKIGGRDLLGLYECFLSGLFPGQILTVVGVDPNNGTYPLVYDVVEAETKDSWTWFLKCLGDDFELFRNSNFTFITDRKKRLMKKIVPVQQLISKTKGPLTSNAQKLFNQIKKEVSQYKLLLYGTWPVMAWKLTYQSLGPRKKRIKTRAELMDNMAKGDKLSREEKLVTCRICKQVGHNQRSCKSQINHWFPIASHVVANAFERPTQGTPQTAASQRLSQVTPQTVASQGPSQHTPRAAKNSSQGPDQADC